MMEETRSPHLSLDVHGVVELSANALYSAGNSPRTSWFEKSVLACFVLIGLNAGWPYFKPAKALFEGNDVLSIASGVSVLFALGSVSAWAVVDYYNYLYLKNFSSKSNRRFELTCLFGALFFGIASALPGAIITLKYNKNIGYLFLSLFLDISTNTAALNRLFREIGIRMRYLNKPTLKALKSVLLNRVALAMHSPDLQLAAPAIGVANEDTMHKVLQLVASVKRPAEQLSKHPKCYGLGRNMTVYIIAALLPAAWEVTACYLSYKDLDKYIHFPFFSMFFSLLAVIPTYTLEFLFAESLFGYAYDQLAHYKNKINLPSRENNLSACTVSNIVTVVLGALLVSLSFAARAQVVKDTFSPTVWRDALLFSTIVGTLVFKLTPIIGNLLRFKKMCVKKPDSEKQRGFLANLLVVLENSSPRALYDFLKTVDFSRYTFDTVLKNRCEQFEQDNTPYRSTPFCCARLGSRSKGAQRTASSGATPVVQGDRTCLVSRSDVTRR